MPIRQAEISRYRGKTVCKKVWNNFPTTRLNAEPTLNPSTLCCAGRCNKTSILAALLDNEKL